MQFSLQKIGGRSCVLRKFGVRPTHTWQVYSRTFSASVHPIKIGGADDHVHILSSLSKNIAFAEMIGRVKGWSSKRLSEKGVLGFAWQNGYGAFSVSESSVEAAYISDQAEHHRKFSYQEELRELLKRHQVAFDERYLWE